MDILRLGEPSDTTYVPDMMCEGFTSKIWTERYFDPGEFQLRTPMVEYYLDILKEDTRLTHRQTKEVMTVENTLVSKDGNGNWELSITGRSCDYILEHRFVEGVYQKRRRMARSYAPNGAALVLLWNSLDNDHDPPYDVTRQRKDDDDPNNDDPDHDGPRWDWNTKDKIPNVAITDSVTKTGMDIDVWWLTEGMLLPQIQKILNRGDLGIRTIRPPSAATTNSERVWVRSTLSELGEIVRVSTGNMTQLRFDVYNGLDRSVDQSTNSRVVFNTLHGHLTGEQYLKSVKDWKNALEIMSSLNRKKDIYRAGQSGLTGWQRKVMAYDAGSPEIPPEPDRPDRDDSDAAWAKWRTKHNNWKNKRDREINQFENDYEKDGLRELNKYRKVALFSADVTSEVPYIYKTHYDLGDVVTIQGAYGEKENMIVAEYTRTEDAEGDRGYPGLVYADKD